MNTDICVSRFPTGFIHFTNLDRYMGRTRICTCIILSTLMLFVIIVHVSGKVTCYPIDCIVFLHNIFLALFILFVFLSYHLVAWTGLIWLRIGTYGGLLWMHLWNVGLHKMRGISRPAEDLLLSQEGLCCIEFLTYHRSDFSMCLRGFKYCFLITMPLLRVFCVFWNCIGTCCMKSLCRFLNFVLFLTGAAGTPRWREHYTSCRKCSEGTWYSYRNNPHGAWQMMQAIRPAAWERTGE